jgi:histone chaperone ASF1
MTVAISDVKVLNNPSSFTSKFKFEITLDCLKPGIKNDLEWKLVYVGSASDETKDQELDDVNVGPISLGKNRFIFEAPPPDVKQINEKDLLDVTVVLLSCSYNEEEFIRIGYYVSNEYNNDNQNNNETIDPNKIVRTILADKPRVTRFTIKWDDNKEEKSSNNNNNNNTNNNTNTDVSFF